MRRLEGRVAVVTGAGSGIGRAIATRFHAEGASVVLGDKSGAEDEVVAHLGDRAVALRVDVGCEDGVAAMIDRATTVFGGLDILCNNAGLDGAISPTGECDPATFDHVVSVNLR